MAKIDLYERENRSMESERLLISIFSSEIDQNLVLIIGGCLRRAFHSHSEKPFLRKKDHKQMGIFGWLTKELSRRLTIIQKGIKTPFIFLAAAAAVVSRFIHRGRKKVRQQKQQK